MELTQVSTMFLVFEGFAFSQSCLQFYVKYIDKVVAGFEKNIKMYIQYFLRHVFIATCVLGRTGFKLLHC